MNLWNDKRRKWALEAESKSEIEGKHLDHKDMFKLVINTPNSYWGQNTTCMSTKCSFLLKWMNLWTDYERKWALEAESKPEIEGKHLHHKDMFK